MTGGVCSYLATLPRMCKLFRISRANKRIISACLYCLGTHLPGSCSCLKTRNWQMPDNYRHLRRRSWRVTCAIYRQIGCGGETFSPLILVHVAPGELSESDCTCI